MNSIPSACSFPDIIGHRGASGDAPENTLAAFQLAFAQGADAVELDLRLTGDGQLAVIHDPSTRRVAGASQTVARCLMTELARLNAGCWGRWKYRGFTERIPSLADVLACLPAGKRLFIELKSGPEILRPLANALERVAPGRIVIIGFDYETVSAAKKKLPLVSVCWLASRRKGARKTAALEYLIRKAQSAGLDGLDLEAGFGIDGRLVDCVHGSGLLLYTWTVDQPAVALQLALSGIDGITTNRPGWLREQIASRLVANPNLSFGERPGVYRLRRYAHVVRH